MYNANEILEVSLKFIRYIIADKFEEKFRRYENEFAMNFRQC